MALEHRIWHHPHILPLVLAHLQQPHLYPLLTVCKAWAPVILNLLFMNVELKHSSLDRFKGKLCKVQGLSVQSGATEFLTDGTLHLLFPNLKSLEINVRCSSQSSLHWKLLSHLVIRDPEQAPRNSIPQPLLPTTVPGRLQSLSLISLSSLTSESLNDYLSQNTGLKEILISSCPALDPSSLSAISQCRGLKDLTLKECDNLFRFPNESTDNNLTTLSTPITASSTAHPIVSIPRRCRLLETLEICGLSVKLQDQHLPSIEFSGFASLDRLHKVTFTRCLWFTSAQLSHFTSVVSLRISVCPLVTYIPPLPQLSTLSILGDKRSEVLTVGNVLELANTQSLGSRAGLRKLSVDTAAAGAAGIWLTNCQSPLPHKFYSSHMVSPENLSSSVFTPPVVISNQPSSTSPSNARLTKDYFEIFENLPIQDVQFRPFLNVSILSPHLPSNLLVQLLSRFQNLETLALFGTHLGGPLPTFPPSPSDLELEHQAWEEENVTCSMPGSWPFESAHRQDTDRRRRWRGTPRTDILPLFEQRVGGKTSSRLSTQQVNELKSTIGSLRNVWV